MALVTTPHINADKEAFGKTVLMPGDPLRSKFIAENFLEDAVLVNNIRGIQGYTGTYQGTKVSVMASGMGMPTIGIYSYELFNFFDVENILSMGLAGHLPRLQVIRCSRRQLRRLTDWGHPIMSAIFFRRTRFIMMTSLQAKDGRKWASSALRWRRLHCI